MFEWLHQHHDSQDLEHARQRQHERDMAKKQQDPLAEYEVLETQEMVVEELAPEMANQLVQDLTHPKRKKA